MYLITVLLILPELYFQLSWNKLYFVYWYFQLKVKRVYSFLSQFLCSFFLTFFFNFTKFNCHIASNKYRIEIQTFSVKDLEMLRTGITQISKEVIYKIQIISLLVMFWKSIYINLFICKRLKKTFCRSKKTLRCKLGDINWWGEIRFLCFSLKTLYFQSVTANRWHFVFL